MTSSLTIQALMTVLLACVELAQLDAFTISRRHIGNLCRQDDFSTTPINHPSHFEICTTMSIITWGDH